MKKALIDSGPLIALFDASDSHHHKSVEFIKKNQSVLITSIASITETLHLLNFNRRAQIDFLQWVSQGAVQVEAIEQGDFSRIRDLTAKYHDLPMDFADCCLVFLAEKLAIDEIATIDRDFTIYRINGKHQFKIILS